MYDFNFHCPITYFSCAITRCVSFSAFAFLVGISIGIESSAEGLNICVITVRIKQYKSIIHNKEKKAW